MLARFAAAIAAMVVVVTASNILVQFPVNADLGPIHLGDILTWGAFTYPVAFLITDLTNRQFGPTIARRVMLAGFVVGIAMSFFSSVPRIAIASGAAYLAGLGTGVYQTLEELESLWQAERTFLPTMPPQRAAELMAQWEHAVRQATLA